MKIKLAADQSVLSSSAKLGISAAVGLIVGLKAGYMFSWGLAPLITWDVAAGLYMFMTWRRVLKFDAGLVKKHALREDPSHVAADLVLVAASIASLVAVGFLLGTGSGSGPEHTAGLVLSVLSVVVSWLMVHTVYALRYAEMYYRTPEGGIDFGGTPPVYADFAYLAFTIGMTYQVSDTSFKARDFRSVALKQAFTSYLFGTIIIATTINLIAGLGK